MQCMCGEVSGLGRNAKRMQLYLLLEEKLHAKKSYAKKFDTFRIKTLITLNATSQAIVCTPDIIDNVLLGM